MPDGEWLAIGRDAANTKYSPLDQIDADNFTDLEIAWRWPSLSTAVAEANERIRPRQFMSVPLMADGLVYVSTALGQVAALDAGTGEPVWSYDPQIYAYLERPANMGWHHRGVSCWKDSESDDARKPPPFDRQDFAIEGVIDFTPELRAEALRIITSRARFGSIFLPPVVRGAEVPFIQVPGGTRRCATWIFRPSAVGAASAPGRW